MFIAHGPAGYLLTTGLQSSVGDRSRVVMATGLVACVFPDFDLAWFYLVDGRQIGHHAYLTHIPAFWVLLAAVGWTVAQAMRVTGATLLIGVALGGVLLHMVLDTVAGGIRWLWPFSEAEFALVKITPKFSWWVWNFLFHWTFLLEIAVTAAAAWLWRKRRFNRS